MTKKNASEASSQLALRASTDLVGAADLNFDSDASHGLENVTARDMIVPRLAILQDLSPQLKKAKSEYIEGAEVGMIADVGIGQTFPGGVWYLPVYYRKDFLEWAPRSSGKGLVAIHSDMSILDKCTLDDKRRPILPNGNYIAETAQFFGVNLSAQARPSFVPMASTQLKKARRWIATAKGERIPGAGGRELPAPLYYRTYYLSTATESNNEGEWTGWTVKSGPSLPEINKRDHGYDAAELLAAAREFYAQLRAGSASGDMSRLDGLDDEEAVL